MEMTDANKEASNDDTSNVYQVVPSPAVPVAEAAIAPASQIDQVATSTSKICLRLKRCSTYEVGASPRKRRTSEMEPENDSFCWICHCDGSLVCCDACPRVFHSRCAGSSKAAKPDEKWTCFVCRNVQLALKKTPLVDLNECLLVVLELMGNVEGSEPFQKPVDVVEFANYRDWIFNPIDLNLLREKIQNGKYSVPQQFLYDCQWILHNCIIYNGDYGELTTVAKAIMRTCKREISELLLCPECYILSIRKPSGWFTSACSKAHKPVWAKLRGYPFWPGKVVNQIGDRYDVRFFGDYDRSKVVKASIKNYSNTPSSPSNQLKDWVSACKEMETYVNNLKKSGCIDLDIFPNRIKSKMINNGINHPLPNGLEKKNDKNDDSSPPKAKANEKKKKLGGETDVGSRRRRNHVITRKREATNYRNFLEENIIETTDISDRRRFELRKDMGERVSTSAYGGEETNTVKIVVLSGNNEEEEVAIPLESPKKNDHDDDPGRINVAVRRKRKNGLINHETRKRKKDDDQIEIPLAFSEEIITTGINRMTMSMRNQMNGIAEAIRKDLEASYRHKLETSLKEQEMKLRQEKEEAVRKTKKKHWCSYCFQEASYFCCIHTSYCSLKCQKKHWATHMDTCTQNFRS